jgi:hypothetical protein
MDRFRILELGHPKCTRMTNKPLHPDSLKVKIKLEVCVCVCEPVTTGLDSPLLASRSRANFIAAAAVRV